MIPCVLGIEIDGNAVGCDGPVQIALSKQSIPKVVVGKGVFRIEAEDFGPALTPELRAADERLRAKAGQGGQGGK